jgi:hypothetical protein
MTPRRCVLLLIALLVSVHLSACGGGGKIQLKYPGETLVFPHLDDQAPRLYIDLVNDLRPESQRAGHGKFATIRFPADDAWEAPVNQIYFQALVQDLTQTNLVELVPMRSQADYILEIDLEHLACRVSRSGAAYFMTGLGGAGLGWLLGQSPGAAVVGAVVGLGAIPVPTRIRAVSQVKLRVYDSEGDLFFEQTCLGEKTRDVWEGLTSRKDQQWVDEYLTVAIKRCNACLLGQLRQAMVEAGEQWQP